MQLKRTLIALAVFGLTGVGAANAACSGFTGVWNFYAFQVNPAASASGHIIKCSINLAADGTFSGAPCTSWQLGQAGGQVVTVSGTITNTSCNLGGTIMIPNDKTVVIRAGHVNGVVAAGIATQGSTTATRLLNFTLVKN